MKYGMFNPESGPGGGMMKAEEQMPTGCTVYVGVPNVNEYLEKAKSLGAQVIMERTEIPDTGAFGMIADPDGIMMGIFEETPK